MWWPRWIRPHTNPRHDSSAPAEERVQRPRIVVELVDRAAEVTVEWPQPKTVGEAQDLSQLVTVLLLLLQTGKLAHQVHKAVGYAARFDGKWKVGDQVLANLLEQLAEGGRDQPAVTPQDLFKDFPS